MRSNYPPLKVYQFLWAYSWLDSAGSQFPAFMDGDKEQPALDNVYNPEISWPLVIETRAFF